MPETRVFSISSHSTADSRAMTPLLSQTVEPPQRRRRRQRYLLRQIARGQLIVDLHDIQQLHIEPIEIDPHP